MTEILPTIKVKHKTFKIEMIINESDFDEKIHTKLGVKDADKAAPVKDADKATPVKDADKEKEFEKMVGL